MKQEYNGHPSYDHWNASLWVSNDEGLYKAALGSSKDCWLELVAECFPRTPDGVTMTPALAAYAWDDVHGE